MGGWVAYQQGGEGEGIAFIRQRVHLEEEGVGLAGEGGLEIVGEKGVQTVVELENSLRGGPVERWVGG